MNTHPFGAKASSEVSAQARRDPLGYDQPNDGAHSKCCRRDSRVGPRRYRGQTKTRPQDQQDEGSRSGGDPPCNDGRPSYAGCGEFVRLDRSTTDWDVSHVVFLVLVVKEDGEKDDDGDRNP